MKTLNTFNSFHFNVNAENKTQWLRIPQVLPRQTDPRSSGEMSTSIPGIPAEFSTQTSSSFPDVTFLQRSKLTFSKILTLKLFTVAEPAMLILYQE